MRSVARGGIVKALIIREPYISQILNGEKTWEMRTTGCNVRGTVGLIRKGSGQVVGIADLVDCKAPITTRAEYANTERFRRVPACAQDKAFEGNWRTPWVMANPKRLAKPVSYKHKSGAVIWVNLEPEVAGQIEAQRQ
jgi:hypothetical protein